MRRQSPQGKGRGVMLVDILRDALLYCKETRARYTVYQLAWDLGLLEKLADEVCAEAECAE